MSRHSWPTTTFAGAAAGGVGRLRGEDDDEDDTRQFPIAGSADKVRFRAILAATDGFQVEIERSQQETTFAGAQQSVVLVAHVQSLRDWHQEVLGG